MDSVSVATTFKETLAEKGIIFVLFRKRLKNIQTWSANTSEQWCPHKDNYYAPSTRQYFLDGSFCYIPKGFVAQWNSQPIFVSIRQAQVSLNAHSSSLMRSYVSYLEGCTAPARDENRCMSCGGAGCMTMQKSNTRLYRTGFLAMPKAKVECLILLPKGGFATKAQRSHGHKWKQARQ